MALEIGCGSGRVTTKVSSFFKHIYATDISKNMTDHGKRIVKESNISFHQTNGFTLDVVKDKSIDVVFSHVVFHLLDLYVVYSYLAEIERKLKVGGVGVISLFGLDERFGTFKSGSLKLWRERRLPGTIHSHYLTEEVVTKLLSDLGLSLVEIDEGFYMTVVFKKEEVNK